MAAPVYDEKTGKWIWNGVSYPDYTAALAAMRGEGGTATTTPTTTTPTAAPAGGSGPFSTIAQGIQDAIGAGREAFNEANALPGISVTDLAKSVKNGSMTAQQMLNALYATGKYTIDSAELEMKANGITPPPREGASPGAASATGGGGGGAAAATSAARSSDPAIQSLLDSFEGFSDKDVFNAYYRGELSEAQLRAVIDARNTTINKTTGAATRKYTDASLDRLIQQINAEKPQKPITKADILGPGAANLAARFNPKAEGFGSVQPIGSSSGVQGEFGGMFGPGSNGTGIIGAFDHMGNAEVARLSLGGTQMGGSDIARILAAYNIKSSGDPIKDAQILSSIQQQTAQAQTTNPSASPSDIARSISLLATGSDPATRRVNPATGNFADLLDAPESVGFMAEGGTVLSRRPSFGDLGTWAREPMPESSPTPTPAAQRLKLSDWFQVKRPVPEDWFSDWTLQRGRGLDSYTAYAERAKAEFQARLDQWKAAQEAFYKGRRGGFPLTDPAAMAPPAPAGGPLSNRIVGGDNVRERERVPMYAGGGRHMVTDEPIVGMGAHSMTPKFVLSSGEALDIRPIQGMEPREGRKAQEENALSGILSKPALTALETLLYGGRRKG